MELDRRRIWHLAQFEGDRRRLVEEPELIPVAIEELLRAYAPVTMALSWPRRPSCGAA